MPDLSYAGVMSRKNEIMKKAIGIDYSLFEYGKLAFDYEGMMKRQLIQYRKSRKSKGRRRLETHRYMN